MINSYVTLAGPGRDEIIIQKSRFIGQAWPCSSEEEALSHIKEVRDASKDARHHCYAYIIGQNEGIIRYSDDGEPGGTAGMPMLSLMRSQKLVNCCAVVTRYFGGVLLGTGGLVRAYTQSCDVALKAAGIIQMENTSFELCEIPYTVWNTVKYTLDHLPARYQELKYGTAVSFQLLTRVEDHEHVLHVLRQIAGQKLETLYEGEQFEAWPR